MSFSREVSKTGRRLKKAVQSVQNRVSDALGRPMVVDSAACEFGFEMYYHIGYAYHAHLQNRLKKTVSCRDTKCFYWFSPDHEERYSKRGFVEWYDRFEHEPHDPPRFDRWKIPDFGGHYQNQVDFGFERPLLMIFNKFNTEWEGNPVNFFSREFLEEIARRYRDRYQVIYARPTSQIVQDDSDLHELNEKERLKEEGVLLIEDVYSRFNDLTFNELQLCLLANAPVRLAVQGGATYMNALFPGKLHILHKRGTETEVGTYDHFAQMGTTEVTVHDDEAQLANVLSATA